MENFSLKVRKWLKSTPLYKLLWSWRGFRTVQLQKRDIRNRWEPAGCPVPVPPLIKWQTVRDYGRKYSLDTLIETGTCMGDTIWFNKNNFRKIYSIELASKFYNRAKEMFAPWKHISIMFGDSSVVLPEILGRINTPVLFWLDAHYSGGSTARGEMYTPIIQEMEYILSHSHPKSIILVDDARLFDGTDDYPKLDFFKKFILDKWPRASIEVSNDITRIVKEK